MVTAWQSLRIAEYRFAVAEKGGLYADWHGKFNIKNALFGSFRLIKFPNRALCPTATQSWKDAYFTRNAD